MLDIGYDKFDTACFNLQHNVIELIKNTVGISVEVNFVSGRVDQAEAKIQGVFDIQGSMLETMNNMNDTLRTLNEALSNTNGALSILAQDVYELDQRVWALEHK